jgi:ornithine decarboxylase
MTRAAGVGLGGVPSSPVSPLSSSSSAPFSSSASSTAGLAAPPARRSAVLDIVRAQVGQRRDAFYVVDLAELSYKHKEWTSQIPRARPFYAVKCNDDPKIVETLAKHGSGFDCASKGEMSMVLGLGVKPSDIIFAHPAKQPSHIAYAKSKGITKMTFDNEDELRKIAQHYPGAQVVLRILADDSASVCRLGLKFGAPLSSVRRLLTVAKELKLDVLGVSYHVGSGNGRAEAFADAVRDARTAFDIAASLGLKLRLLDIGGGFPGSDAGIDLGEAETARNAASASASSSAADDDSNPYAKHPSFRSIATHVRAALTKHFPEGCGVDIIAEPGRFYAKSTHVLAVNIVGKRATEDEGGLGTRWNYYVNDGLYGSFNCVLYDHASAYPSFVLRAGGAGELDLSAVKAAAAEQIARRGAKGAAGAAAAAAAVPPSAAAASSASAPVHTPAVSVPSHGGSVFASTLWGPTCDSIDKITDSALMPELSVGDWLVFENMGAYTIAGSCRFNGFPLSTKIYRSGDGALLVQGEEEHA